MNYAVRTFKNLPTKVAGAPDNYPAEVRPLGDSTTLPGARGWQLMSQVQLDDAKTVYQEQFDRWQVLQSVTPMEEKHEVNLYNAQSNLVSETWFKTKVATGVYSDKAREILYSYDASGGAIVSKVEKFYDYNGVLYETITTNLLSDTSTASRQVIFEKV